MGDNKSKNKTNGKKNYDEINRQLKVTPIYELEKYAKGEVVEFPPFAENQPFVAKVKRPSMMVLMKTGKIPNSLLATANSIFSGNSSNAEDEDFYKDMLDILDVIAEASFVEPTWQELKEANIELTDEQYTFLFNYTQRGVRALAPFRK